jgi:hypothetical protein
MEYRFSSSFLSADTQNGNFTPGRTAILKSETSQQARQTWFGRGA